MTLRPIFASLVLLLLAAPASAQLTWCGKVYKANDTVVPPGGQFQTPLASQTPLLALRCQPSLVPFLPDDSSTAEIIVDALVRYAHIAGAQDFMLPSGDCSSEVVTVTASIDSVQVATGSVALNGTTLLPFSLSALSPRSEPYNLTCTGTLPNQSGTFSSLPADLTFLPDPPSGIGSVTKRDLRTGGVLVKRLGAKPSSGYERLLPVGFYTSMDDYLAGNDSAVETIAQQGLNIIHPIPPYENLTAFDELVDKMEELGLWLMYDMRWTYMNLTAVQAETVPLHNRTNLLTYYTGDEPDGTSDPLNATSNAYDLLRSLDPYRPTSLVLNCQNYYFEEYASGADILLQDVYMIGNNVTYSSQWGTPCTPERGDCGCDNCRGEFEDIRDRVSQFRERMEVLGWERSKTIWTVPQGFGNDTYWKRYPTGAEWLVQAIVGLNAGSFGTSLRIVSWTDPTTPDIKSASSSLARSAPSLVMHMLSPTSTFVHVITDDRLDIGVWFDPAQGSALLLGTNLEYKYRKIKIEEVLAKAGLVRVTGGDVAVVFDGGATIWEDYIVFGIVESGAWVVKAYPSMTANADS